jgi:hypothetical protein
MALDDETDDREPLLPIIRWGSADAPLPDWREEPDADDDADDDVELAETPADVIAQLGFDPLDIDWDADDAPPAQDEAKFDEDKHPRRDDGKFGKGGGGAAPKGEAKAEDPEYEAPYDPRFPPAHTAGLKPAQRKVHEIGESTTMSREEKIAKLKDMASKLKPGQPPMGRIEQWLKHLDFIQKGAAANKADAAKAKAKPVAPPPKPEAKPEAKAKPKAIGNTASLDDLYQKPDISPAEKSYHRTAWEHAHPTILAAVLKAPKVEVTKGGDRASFFHPIDHSITMTSRYVPGSVDGDSVWRHEFGHSLDFSKGYYQQQSLAAEGARRQDEVMFMTMPLEDRKELVGSDNAKLTKQEIGALMDFVGAMTLNKVGGGHPNSYYNRIPGAQTAEMFANYVDLTNGSASERFRTVLHKIAPRACKKFDAIIDGLANR